MVDARDERVVTIAAKLYEARRVLRGLFGGEYDERIEPYRGIVRGEAGKQGLDYVTATAEIVKRAQADRRHGMVQLCFLAACVDLVEAEQPVGG